MTTAPMEIVFVSPYEDITAYPVRILSAILRRAGFPTHIVFAPFALERHGKEDPAQLAAAIGGLGPRVGLVGLSFMSCHLPFAADLTRALKARSEVPVVWGGKHISAQPEDGAGLADILCLAEADTTVVALAGALARGEDWRGLKGVSFWEGAALRRNPLNPLVANLDELPLPDYSLVNHHLWDGRELRPMDRALFERHTYRTPQGNPIYMTMGSRGCPHACTYCYTFRDLYPGERYVRFRSPANIVDEFAGMIERFPFLHDIVLSDDNYFAQKDAVLEEFAERYRRRVDRPLRCLAHPQSVTRRKIEILAAAGLRELQIGVQTGSEGVQKLYRRTQSPEKVLQAVRTINEFKDRVVPFYDFIIDNPYESREDLLETLRLLHRFPRPYRLNIFSLSFFPGTELYRKAIAEGRIVDVTKVYEFRSKSYLNGVFRLYATPAPKWVLRALISRPAVALLDNRVGGQAIYVALLMARTVMRALRPRREHNERAPAEGGCA